jgi:ribosome-associated protein
MSNDVTITETITIPAHELEIVTSRAGGPGGQHVNKTSSRITVYWSLLTTQALSAQEKERAQLALANRLTTEGYLIIHNSSTRSQLENKRRALKALADLVRKALYVPKKRTKTAVSKQAKETRLRTKARRSDIKKTRSKKIVYD